jgi:hypothetical protein
VIKGDCTNIWIQLSCFMNWFDIDSRYGRSTLWIGSSMVLTDVVLFFLGCLAVCVVDRELYAVQDDVVFYP